MSRYQFEKDVLGMQTCDCIVCGEETPYLGTRQCDRCWELVKRISADPELARKILDNILVSEKIDE